MLGARGQLDPLEVLRMTGEEPDLAIRHDDGARDQERLAARIDGVTEADREFSRTAALDEAVENQRQHQVMESRDETQQLSNRRRHSQADIEGRDRSGRTETKADRLAAREPADGLEDLGSHGVPPGEGSPRHRLEE